jgi:spore germination protein YaaH
VIAPVPHGGVPGNRSLARGARRSAANERCATCSGVAAPALGAGAAEPPQPDTAATPASNTSGPRRTAEAYARPVTVRRCCLLATLTLALALALAGCGGNGDAPLLHSSAPAPATTRAPAAPVVQPPVQPATSPAVPQRAATPTASPHPKRFVSLWLPAWNMGPALRSALADPALVGRVSPVWYSAQGTTVSGAGDPRAIRELRAHRMAVVPTVTEGDGATAFAAVLADPARRALLVSALAATAIAQPYAGIDLDFEQLAVGPDAAADRVAQLYPVFAAQLAQALHAERRTLTITVMPRTDSGHERWRGRLATWVYDYVALARAADRIRIMAYDENAPPATTAGPVAPWAWTWQVIEYARATMAPARVELGLAAYGYDWANGSATTVSARAAPALALAHGVAPHWDPQEAEETFSYPGHTVWYEDTAADSARARLALQAGFAGVGIWAAGDEDPSLWPALVASRP